MKLHELINYVKFELGEFGLGERACPECGSYNVISRGFECVNERLFCNKCKMELRV